MNIDSSNPFPAWNPGFILLWLYYELPISMVLAKERREEVFTNGV
jgi:hypothetical protein